MAQQTTIKVRSPFHRLLLPLLGLLAVVVVGSAGFVVLERLSFFEALYMTLVTISTLGMRLGAEPAMGPGGKFWVMCLIVIGIATAMVALTAIVGIVVEGHLRSILGRRKVNQKIASLNGHIIVCGYGRMGRLVCDNLRRRGAPLVVIEQDDHQTAQVEEDGFLYVLGDASEESVLRDVGIERAKTLVAVLPTDADNVFVTLIARDLNSKLFIVARAEITSSQVRLQHAGANRAICPQAIGATRLANIITRPGVVDFIDFASEGLDLEAEQIRIGAESKLVGQSLRQANLPREVGILIVALKRKDGQTVFNPGPDTVLEEDDVMIVTGQVGSMAKLQQEYS